MQFREIPDIWFAARARAGRTPAEAVEDWEEQERLQAAYEYEHRGETARQAYYRARHEERLAEREFASYEIQRESLGEG